MADEFRTEVNALQPISYDRIDEGIEAIENAILKAGVADGIGTSQLEKKWNDVLTELNRLSIEDASLRWGTIDKTAYKIRPEHWVHGRVMGLLIHLSAWMGFQWESHFPGLKKQDFLNFIGGAYDVGHAHKRP
jgi:hypothetical protein